MPPNTADPGRPMGAGISHFSFSPGRRFRILPTTTSRLFAGSGRRRDPAAAGGAIFFRAKTRGFVKVQGDPHSANFVNQNRETALQMSR